MVQAGQMPGAGSYECDLCGEIVKLIHQAEMLEPCPYCKMSEYLELDASADIKKDSVPDYYIN